MRMATFGWPVLAWCVVVGVLAARGAELTAPSPASTRPAISDRQASILLQLADAEANIKVINQALLRTGYKVGVAYDRIENSQKANELMDRKGGGPVRWDEFYGRTARDFYAPQNVGAVHTQGGRSISLDAKAATGYRPIQSPRQFDFIYRANDEQISRAREQIASLLQNQSALLARRHKHEADQSTLWAELAWEQVRDREIAFRPTYRFALKGDAARVALLRGPILFLRVANQAVVDGLESVESDQSGTFDGLRARTKAAYAALQETMSMALLAPDVSAADAKQAGELKAICKQIAEECLVIDDNYRKAADSDRANEDASKLEYRSQLQSSLAKLAGLIGGLDDQISKVAVDWTIAPQVGVESPDKLPPVPTPSPGRSPVTAEGAPSDEPARIVLFDGTDTSQWEPVGSTMWEVEDGALVENANDIQTKQKFRDYQLHIEFNEPVLGPRFKGQDRGNSGVYQQGRYELQVLDSYDNQTYPDGACGAVYKIKAPLRNAAKPPGEWQTYDITFHAAKWDGDKKVKDARITVYWNGELVQDDTDIPHSTGGGAQESDAPGPIRLQWHHHHVKFRNIWIVPLTGAGESAVPERPAGTAAETSSAAANAGDPVRQLTPQQRAIATGLQFSDVFAGGNEHHLYGGASVRLRNVSPAGQVTERVRARSRLLCINADGKPVVLEIWSDVKIGKKGDQVLYLGGIPNSEIRFNNADRTTPLNAQVIIYLADVPIYEGTWKPGDRLRWWEDDSLVKKY